MLIDRITRQIIYYTWLLPLSKKNSLVRKSQHENICIFAMGRGGSTMLMEAIQDGIKDSTTLIWEPLAAGGIKIKKLKKWNFYLQPYIPEEEKNIDLIQIFQSLFNRENLNLSLTYHNKNLFKVPFNKKFIYKFCRGNLLLPWLVNNFNIKSILILRSPYDVINSQINHNAYSELKKNPAFIIPQGTPYVEFFSNYQHILDKCNSPEEHLAIKWALNNLIINHKLNDRKWVTVYYEELLNNPKKEIDKINSRLQLDLDIESTLNSMKKVSRTGSSGKKGFLTSSQVDKINQILLDFDLLEFTKEHFPPPKVR